MQIYRQFTILLHHLLDAQDVRKDLAFVVGCAARKNVSILQNRLERWRIPKLQRIWGLHIVMSVDQNGAPPGPMLIVRPNDRMTRRGNELCLQTNTREFLHEPMRTFGQSFGVLVVGRDTWKPQERIKIFKVTWTHADNGRPTFRHLPLNYAAQIEMSLSRLSMCRNVREMRAPSAPKEEAGLIRAIGVPGLTANIVNSTIGAGIFALPALVAAQLGAASPLAYIICAFAMCLFVTSFAMAGSRVSLTGGLYAYVEVAFGRYVGFLAGVLYFLTAILAISGIVTLIAASVGRLIPILATQIGRVVVILCILVL